MYYSYIVFSKPNLLMFPCCTSHYDSDNLLYLILNLFSIVLIEGTIILYILPIFQLLNKLGINVVEEQINGVDHFDIVENLSNDEYSLTKLIIHIILNYTIN